jgi:diadenosine hexaphosphate hydrolase (ATP-forming)
MNPDHWVFPKGHIKPGETTEEAALREVREEAGVKATILSGIGDSEFTRGDEHIRVKYFVMRYEAEGQADEDRKTKWCTYEEVAALLQFEDARRVLGQAERFLEAG